MEEKQEHFVMLCVLFELISLQLDTIIPWRDRNVLQTRISMHIVGLRFLPYMLTNSTIVCQPECPICRQSNVHRHCCPDPSLRSPVVHLTMSRKTPPPWDYSLLYYIVSSLYNSICNPTIIMISIIWTSMSAVLLIWWYPQNRPLFFIRSVPETSLFSGYAHCIIFVFNSAVTRGRRAFQMSLEGHFSRSERYKCARNVP